MRKMLLGLAVFSAISMLGTVWAIADAGCDQCEATADGCGCDRWTASTDILFLTRSNPRSAELVTDPVGTPLINAADYHFGTATGIEFALTRHNVLGTCWDIEAIYTVVDSWNASIGTIHSPNGAVVRFITALGTLDPVDISSTYRTDLHSIELNGKRPLGDRLTLIAGFRYLDLSEEGLASIVGDPSLGDMPTSITAHNRLTGGQIGLDAKLLCCERFQLGSTIKAGVYNNDASNAASFTYLNVPLTKTSNASANQTAFVGELGFMAVYDVTCRLSLRAGYRLMWIDGVALASNQIAVSDPDFNSAVVHTADTLFYHGATAGLEYRF